MPITPPQHMPVPSYSIHRFVKDYSMNRGKLEFLEKNIIKNYGVRLRWQVQHDIQSPGLKSRPIKVGTKTHSNKITWRFFLSPKTWKPWNFLSAGSFWKPLFNTAIFYILHWKMLDLFFGLKLKCYTAVNAMADWTQSCTVTLLTFFPMNWNILHQ